MTSSEALWQVVGGALGFGILVRAGKELSSKQAPERLATGALVKALEHDESAGRMHYELIQGIGPATGWVSTKVQGKALLVKSEQSKHEGKEEEVQDDALLVQSAQTKHEEKEAEVQPVQNGANTDVSPEDEVAKQVPRSLLRAELERDLGIQAKIPINACVTKRPGKPGRLGKSEYDVAEDTDGEEVHLCRQCGLALGDRAYKREGIYMHGECIAQLMIQSMREEEEARQKKEKAKKAARRMDYDIRWSTAQIPRNIDIAKKLECPSSAEGMVCVLLKDSNMSASLAATTEPAASINLEYLSTALQVRRKEGREPIFSLDPSNLHQKNAPMEKVFIPEWIAGTSAGEVMFQADYHLKELSMGECEQPVVGMRSCFDYSESEGFEQDWCAREWFTVRDAEVRVTEGGMLLPCVKMGIEAREQVMGKDGLEDAALTRADHPMVKYADSFTHNFDLIAERKSVIYHLRELSKATVLAKFLIDFRINLEESWFKIADQSTAVCSIGWEVPQLWNERMHTQVEMKDGALVDAKKLTEKGPLATMHGVYGGIDFGLDNFSLAGIDFGLDNFSLAAGLVTRMGRPGRRTAGLSSFELTGAKPLSTGIPSSRRAPHLVLPPSYLSQTDVTVEGTKLQGVDLCLDKFNFNPKRATLEASAIEPLDAAPVSGRRFWSGIDGNASIFNEEDKKLLKDIFNPHLSDRRLEGDGFIFPDTSHSRVEKLRALLRVEDAVRQMRKEHFYSDQFSPSEPGPLFPSSWSSVYLASGSVPLKLPASSGVLHPRPNLLAEAPALAQALKPAIASFDKSTEDGLRFRIYMLGSLQVRTTQEDGGEEELGAVFSACADASQKIRFTQSVGEDEKIVKFTEYVEQALHMGQSVQPECCIPSRYYVVLETEQGHRLVTEQTSDGTIALQQDSGKLDDRVSLAKTLRSSDCKRVVTIQNFKDYRAAARSAFSDGASPSACKHFARQTFDWLSGASPRGTTSESRPMPWKGSSSAVEIQRKPTELQLMAQCLQWTA